MTWDVTASEFESALQAAGVGVWHWDVASGQVRWSEEIRRLLGYPGGAFLGTFEAYLALVHPEDRAEFERGIEGTVTGGENFHVEHRVRRGDGSYVWVEARGGARSDAEGRTLALFGSVVEITGRKREEQARSVLEEQYRLFTELASDYVYVVDMLRPSLVPKIVAGSFERTTGYTLEAVEALGGWFKLMHPDDLAAAGGVVAELAQGRLVVNEYRIRDASGSELWLRDRIRPILDPDTGALVRLMGGVTDITESKQLQEQLIRAQRLDALAQLAGGVAHDFNNLLLVLFSAIDSLSDCHSAGSPPGTEDLDNLSQVARRAHELTRSLLAFGRKQVTTRRAGDLRDVVREALPILVQALGERISVLHELPAESVTALLDPGQLQLVLLNLALNARDAMPGGGELRLRVHISQLTEQDPARPPELAPGDWATLSVSDNGAGMDEETRLHVFEPFYTTKPVGTGTGLGLAISHGVAGQLGGAITVESAPGKGATFRLYLPLTSADATVPDAAQSSLSRASSGGTESILLIDDDPQVRRVLARGLRARGYRVLEHEAAEPVLALSDAVLADFNLVISDVRLPGIDGVELCQHLLARCPALRFLLISGYVAAQASVDELGRGHFPFLAKPFTPEGLARRVRETLDQSR